MIKGSCLCGGVQYEYDGEISEVVVCHCNMCKRAQGTALVTNAPIERSLFRIVAGEELLKPYASSEQKQRVFCAHCGSPLYSCRTDKPGVIRLRVGTVTSGSIPKPSYQIHCESAADWFVLDDSQEKYPQGKP